MNNNVRSGKERRRSIIEHDSIGDAPAQSQVLFHALRNTKMSVRQTSEKPLNPFGNADKQMGLVQADCRQCERIVVPIDYKWGSSEASDHPRKEKCGDGGRSLDP